MSEVVLIVESVFSKRDYDRFGIEILQSKGFKPLVWDCTEFLNVSSGNSTSQQSRHEFSGLTVFKDQISVLKRIEAAPKDTVFILLTGYTYRHLPVFKALSQRKDVLLGAANFGPLPTVPLQAVPMQTALRLIRGFSKPAELGARLFHRTPPRFWGVRPLDFFLVSGKRSLVKRTARCSSWTCGRAGSLTCTSAGSQRTTASGSRCSMHCGQA